MCNTFAQSRDCANVLRNCLRNLKIGTQFRDSENALCNLEIAQIPKLRGTDTQGNDIGLIFELCIVLGILG